MGSKKLKKPNSDTRSKQLRNKGNKRYKSMSESV